MDWQQSASLAIVALTGYLFVRHEMRTRRKLPSRFCSSDCGCGAPVEPGPAIRTSHTKPNEGAVTPDGTRRRLESAV